MRKYTSAVIGCGRIGSEFDEGPVTDKASSHAGAYFMNPRTELVCGCDPRPGKLDAFRGKWGTSGYRDLKDMLKKEQIDILSVCTPPETHYGIVKDIASSCPVKAIWCEKPIALDAREAAKMVDLCRKKNILLMINHQRRFSPFFRELKKRIDEGMMGRVQQVNCYYTRGIMNTGVHIVDLFSFLFGRAEWVEAVPSMNRSSFKDDPNLDVTTKYRKGPLVTMKACDDADYLIFEIDILGSKARLRIGDGIEYFKAKKGKNLLKKNVLVKQDKAPIKAVYEAVSLEEGARHIVACLDGKAKPVSSGSDGKDAVMLINAMHSSAKTGKRSLLN